MRNPLIKRETIQNITYHLGEKRVLIYRRIHIRVDSEYETGACVLLIQYPLKSDWFERGLPCKIKFGYLAGPETATTENFRSAVSRALDLIDQLLDERKEN